MSRELMQQEGIKSAQVYHLSAVVVCSYFCVYIQLKSNTLPPDLPSAIWAVCLDNKLVVLYLLLFKEKRV